MTNSDKRKGIGLYAQCASVGRAERRRPVSRGADCEAVSPGNRFTVSESKRVNGLPRKKVVCYLGSLAEGHRESVWTRVDFWDRAAAKLDKLQLTRRERAKIEESISRVVSRVPEEEAATFRRERQEFFDELDRLLRIKRMISI